MTKIPENPVTLMSSEITSIITITITPTTASHQSFCCSCRII